MNGTRDVVRTLTFLEAGEMIKEGQAKRFSDDSSLDTKANAIDVSVFACRSRVSALTMCREQLVTEVDQAVEAFISKTISETYPSHKLCVSDMEKNTGS